MDLLQVVEEEVERPRFQRLVFPGGSILVPDESQEVTRLRGTRLYVPFDERTMTYIEHLLYDSNA